MATQANAGDVGLTVRVTENEKQIARLQGSYDHVSTKADIADVRTEISDVRTEISDVRTEIAKLRADLTWRILIAMGVFSGLVMAFIEWRVVGS